MRKAKERERKGKKKRKREEIMNHSLQKKQLWTKRTRRE